MTRRVKSSDEFFRGERKFNKWIMLGQGFGAVSGVAATFLVYYILNYINSEVLEIAYKWNPEEFGWAV